MTVDCEHGVESHDGTEPSRASAPEAARAWLLIEHPGPWPHEAIDADLPEPVRSLATAAAQTGIRVQLIRRPGRRETTATRAIFAGWTEGDDPWLRRAQYTVAGPEPSTVRVGGATLADRDPGERILAGVDLEGVDLEGVDLEGIAEGQAPGSWAKAAEPLFLVCAHGQRNACCARLGAPLARQLAGYSPGEVWETTHVGGHRFAANLVILPHGLYFGPVGFDEATKAIDSYRAGQIATERYRGRAGQPRPVQEADYDRLTSTGCPLLCQR